LGAKPLIRRKICGFGPEISGYTLELAEVKSKEGAIAYAY
jgi:hypothetical protein